ncbi:MAG: type II/IV secretion system protein [Gammaproteobacteria bacterium]|nr:type II/IV secretion system protein [Gammaproteobacteria bacterium]NIR81811.1 type II/IV secretion system protein [Gammaproteobacteria bacterium]NIR88643.1 type II/IV secretion system protein [Gammaproteobacteria bacterium]NIU02919.1 type II/IV secretion system protein [Gammaproteobacteria bacterium]NIV50440.1 MSHA biogenesis protein MshE [Gammaproteobacteria bacterium]
MKPRKKIRLGDLLVENKIISRVQLESALAEQKRTGRKLGRTLVELGHIGEESLLKFLSRQLDIPYIDLRHYKFDLETVRLMPEIQARRYRAIALERKGSEVLVGMADPTDIFAFDELARALKRPIRVAVVKETELLRTFDTVYRRTQEITTFAEELGEELFGEDVDIGRLAESEGVADAPVVKLIQSLFEDAAQINASDIHIEPEEDVLRIRQRVDGVLHEQVMDEKRIAPALVLRLKLMAGLDIAEKRLPQDGRFTVRVKGRIIDVRLATMPIQFGESVVLRLLDQSFGPRKLEQLGMSWDLRRLFERTIATPHGMILVTGPTGSGKTTTLYAALNQLNTAERKIITVEDPVEYRIPRINQVQVRSEIGLGFARVLRSVLRHDPDIVLVGEMRDEETVDIGMRAAMTGHLVLSTLHTNDAISTVHRLLDMGAEGYVVASALKAVVAQRLMRRVCEGCAEAYTPKPYHRAWLQEVLGGSSAKGQFRVGAGCTHCNQTGYRGRLGVFEILEMDEALQEPLSRGDAGGFVALARDKLGGRTLIGVAAAHALQGSTTLDEAIRLAGGIEDTTLNDPEGDPSAASQHVDQVSDVLSISNS